MAKLTYQEIEFRLLLLQISALLCDMTCHCQNQTNIICLNENKLNSVIHNEEKFDFSNFCIDAIILKLTMLKNSQIQTILSANLSKVIFAEISNSENFIMSEDVFLNLRNLQELSLVNNKLKKLQKYVFGTAPYLKSLNLNENLLQVLQDGEFEKLRNLNKLYLENNKISKLIDSPFKNLLNLKYLSLAHNEIGLVTTLTFKGLKKLETLIMSDNNIVKFSPGIFQSCFE